MAMIIMVDLPREERLLLQVREVRQALGALVQVIAVAAAVGIQARIHLRGLLRRQGRARELMRGILHLGQLREGILPTGIQDTIPHSIPTILRTGLRARLIQALTQGIHQEVKKMKIKKASQRLIHC